MIYTPIQGSVVITYIDDTTGKILHNVIVNGNDGTLVNYDPQPLIKQYEKAGYQLVHDGYPTNVMFSNQQQHFEIHFDEGMITYTPSNNPRHLDLTHTFTRTVNYVDHNGQYLLPSIVQTLTFTRTATLNQVTGQLTYSAWYPVTNNLPMITVPDIVGYTHQLKVIAALAAVTANEPDQVVNVLYTPLPGKPATLPLTTDLQPVTATINGIPVVPVNNVVKPVQSCYVPEQVTTPHGNLHTTSTRLPQTGDHHEDDLWLGLALLGASISLMLGLAIDHKRSK